MKRIFFGLTLSMLWTGIAMAQQNSVTQNFVSSTETSRQRQIELDKQHKIVAERWRLPLKNHGTGYYGKH